MKTYSCPLCGLGDFDGGFETSLADHLYEGHGTLEMAEHLEMRVAKEANSK